MKKRKTFREVCYDIVGTIDYDIQKTCYDPECCEDGPEEAKARLDSFALGVAALLREAGFKV